MQAFCQLFSVALLAFVIQARVPFLETERGLPRYLLLCGLAFFAVTWADFLVYAALGWGPFYVVMTWAVRIGPLVYLLLRPGNNRRIGDGIVPTRDQLSALTNVRGWNYAFLFFAFIVLSRFFVGIVEDNEGTVWTNFNFVDTAFHLSIAQAFLNATSFPPPDPNLAGFPLKYHFLSDFAIAHLARLGMPLIDAVWWPNLFGAASMAGGIWLGFKRWLDLPSRWVLLACVFFLFANLALVNVIHFCLANPPFLNPKDAVDGVFFFPYFNFESIHNNLVEPQRGLVFVMPVIIAVLAITQPPAGTGPSEEHVDRRHTLLAFALVCLLPLAHVVSFAVLGACLLPKLLRHRRWLFTNPWWLPAFALGIAQLGYILAYGPPIEPGFSGWDVMDHMPLRDFDGLPVVFRRAAFWLAVNGDFFFWGVFFTVIAVVRAFCGRPLSAGALRVREFGERWTWYFFVCLGAFFLINYYRYAASWGDSNKFVFFLNLGLTLIIVIGAAQWIGGPHALRSRAAWWFFFLLALVPNGFDHFKKQFLLGARANLLFHHQARYAADWIMANTAPDAVFLTAAGADSHFLPALAARSSRAGIYVFTNPYLRPDLPSQIRRFYEEADPSLLPKFAVDYVCVSATERNIYTLDPRWTEWLADPELRVFSIGETDDHNSVYLLDARRLMARAREP